jgi:hypothetical protein
MEGCSRISVGFRLKASQELPPSFREIPTICCLVKHLISLAIVYFDNSINDQESESKWRATEARAVCLLESMNLPTQAQDEENLLPSPFSPCQSHAHSIMNNRIRSSRRGSQFSLMNETFVARKAFAAYLVSSAASERIITNGAFNQIQRAI